jgi:endonuclease-3
MGKDTTLQVRRQRAQEIMVILRKAIEHLPSTMSQEIADEYGKDPFTILVSCLLSLRARDVVTLPVSRELFKHAKTPQQMLALSLPTIERIIHSIGFFHRKAKTLHAISKVLIEEYQGKVPSTEEELLALPGVGRKTANLVLAQAFGVSAICVDTHVHALANKLGLVESKTPHQTELQLQELIPRDQWSEINRVLVIFGQNRKKVCALLSSSEQKALHPVCTKILQ